MEESLKLPIGVLSGKIKKTLGISLDTHVPGAGIKKGLKMIDQPGKIRANSEDWKKTKHRPKRSIRLSYGI